MDRFYVRINYKKKMSVFLKLRDLLKKILKIFKKICFKSWMKSFRTSSSIFSYFHNNSKATYRTAIFP